MGAIAVVLVSVMLLMRTIQMSEEDRAVHCSAGRALVLSSFVVLIFGFTNLSTIPLLLVLNLLMLVPVFYGFKTWLQLPGAETRELA